MSHGPVGSSVPLKVGNHEKRIRVVEREMRRPRGAGTFELIANANVGGTLPFGSLTAWAPESALDGAPPLLLGTSWVWLWEAGEEANVSIRNNTTTDRTINLAGGWVRNLATGEEEILTGDPVSVAAGSFARVEWEHAAGDTLLDTSTADRPEAISTAPYAVAVSVQVV